MPSPKAGRTKLPTVNAHPVKSFFVSMLTRDITLNDAILDLLDNCVDGIIRNGNVASGTKSYRTFYANINFDEESFSIDDNCGGIPKSLRDYAFRLGREADGVPAAKGTVGAYGIGMKRAIFKIGRESSITTQSRKSRYEVTISPRWLTDEKNWKLPVRDMPRQSKKVNGTKIVVRELNDVIKIEFGEDRDAFEDSLIKTISTQYAFIIDKGFKIKVNGKTIIGKPSELIYADDARNGFVIRPYIYRANFEDVDIFLAVGFRRRIPSAAEAKNESEGKKNTSLEAGWTVLCNERAVLYCDKTALTGWGIAGVPQYHPQFIAISGIVEFRCDDPSKLPTTTTKHGIDASSELYLLVKEQMREGMRHFIRYTNKWKNDVRESNKHMESGTALTFNALKKKCKGLPFESVGKRLGGERYSPPLPMPKSKSARKKVTIRFQRAKTEVNVIRVYLESSENETASLIGEQCFEIILEEARR